MNFLFFIKCSKHEEQGLYQQELQLEDKQQSSTVPAPCPPRLQPSSNSWPGAETPNKNLGFNSKLPETALAGAFCKFTIKDEWKVSLRADPLPPEEIPIQPPMTPPKAGPKS